MKKLFIVRHAKSSWDDPDLDDFDRPLNTRGKRNAPEIGKRLAMRGVNPDLIITSPAKRAAATARRIAEEISYPKSKIIKEENFYHGTIQEVITIVQKLEDHVNSLMIFGHNPGLTDLANYLSSADIYNIPTCGVVEIDFDIASWKMLGSKTGKLINFDFPKNNSSGQLK
jgi:phosphohistidine phosphatase